MNLPTPSMFYITAPWHHRREPTRCVYEQLSVTRLGNEHFVALWPTQYLPPQNLDMTVAEIGQLLGGN